MKTLILTLFVATIVFAQGASAEEYMDCHVSGQSDAVRSAPTRVELSQSEGWYLGEDGREVHGFRLKDSSKGVSVKYKRVEGDTVFSYSYFFDDRECENAMVGSATLVLNGITTIYDCTCSVD